MTALGSYPAHERQYPLAPCPLVDTGSSALALGVGTKWVGQRRVHVGSGACCTLRHLPPTCALWFTASFPGIWERLEYFPTRSLNVRVLVTGATGYIGGLLVPSLVNEGHEVRCVARLPERLAGRFAGVDVVRGDVFNAPSMLAAMDGIEVAYYLIHSMTADRYDFSQSDRLAAATFGDAARKAGVKRIIFLGGLGVD